MARETRKLRPFETLVETQSAMWEGVQITAFDPDKRAAFANEKLVLSPDDYLASPVVLWFFRNAGDHETFAKKAYEEIRGLYPDVPGLVHLVVAVHNKRLKMTELLLDVPITSEADIPMAINLHEAGPEKTRPRPLQTPGDGCEVSVEFVLGRDVSSAERRPFRAWRKGSWLARTTIGVATSADSTGPRPLPLTDAVRAAKEVPDNTVHLTQFLVTGASLLSAETFEDVLEFYVDEEVLDHVEKDPLAGWSQRLQLGWILDVSKTFVLMAMQDESFEDFDPEEAPWSGSVLRAILDKVVASPSVEDVQAALALLRTEPWRFFAVLEDQASLLPLERALVMFARDGGY